MNQLYTMIQKALGERVLVDEPLGRYTTFKIGGPADLFYEARTEEELVAAVGVAREAGVPLFLLGGGTNILIGDRGIRGLVIKNATSSIVIKGMKGKMKGGTPAGIAYVQADCGVLINKLVRFTCDEGLAGLEMHLGLPGTVGGAVYMNSKWTNPVGYVGDVVYQATILTPDGHVKMVPKTYFQFAYDYSTIQKTHDIVLSVVFGLEQQDKDVLWQRANASVSYRRETQPQGVFSPGCTFKNISTAQAFAVPTPNHTTSAGFLVDHVGLKGVRIGDAQISPIHANFIINHGKATARDVVQLIDLARKKVQDQFGVTLTEEVVCVGEF